MAAGFNGGNPSIYRIDAADYLHPTASHLKVTWNPSPEVDGSVSTDATEGRHSQLVWKRVWKHGHQKR